MKDYYCINLPYRINSVLDLNNLYGGQIVSDSCRINDHLNEINAKTDTAYTSGNLFRILMPPLGRMIPFHTAEYMKEMLKHPKVESVFTDSLNIK